MRIGNNYNFEGLAVEKSRIKETLTSNKIIMISNCLNSLGFSLNSRVFVNVVLSYLIIIRKQTIEVVMAFC